MKKLVFCLIALTPAFALAAPGPYATVQAGLNQVNSNNIIQNDTYGFVGGAALGYLWGNNAVNYGLEADGLVYPNSNSSKSVNAPGDIQSTYDGYNISLLGVLKFTSCSTGLTGFVKAGGAYVNQQLTLTQYGNSVTFKEENSIEPEAAIGAGYMLTPNLEATITWDHVFANDQKTSDWAANRRNVVTNDNYLLGLTYHFA